MDRTDTTVLESHLRRLDGERLVALVADLWAARGYETDREGGVVRATHGDEVLRIAVVPAGGGGGDGRSGAADVVVAPGGTAVGHEARVVDAATLAEMLGYAVDRPVARDICERHLGAPPDALPAPLATRTRRRARGVLDSAVPSVLAVVALVAVGAFLAGGVLGDAAGLAGQSDAGDDGTVTTATPTADADVRADTDRPPSDVSPEPFPSAPDTPPPGVSETSVTDVEALAAAHERALADRSHTVWLDRRSRRLNGADRVIEHDIDMATDGERFLVTTTRVDGEERQVLGALYYNGVAAYEAEYNTSGDGYDRVSAVDSRNDLSPSPDSVRESLVWRYLSAENTTVTGTTVRGGSVVYRVVATGRAEARGFDHVWNYTAVAQVDARGFVRDLTVEFDARSGSRVFRVRHEITYDRVGSTDFEPPVWYRPDAINATAA